MLKKLAEVIIDILQDHILRNIIMCTSAFCLIMWFMTWLLAPPKWEDKEIRQLARYFAEQLQDSDTLTCEPLKKDQLYAVCTITRKSHPAKMIECSTHDCRIPGKSVHLDRTSGLDSIDESPRDQQ